MTLRWRQGYEIKEGLLFKTVICYTCILFSALFTGFTTIIRDRNILEIFCDTSKNDGPSYFNIALAFQDECLPIFFCPANTCTYLLKL